MPPKRKAAAKKVVVDGDIDDEDDAPVTKTKRGRGKKAADDDVNKKAKKVSPSPPPAVDDDKDDDEVDVKKMKIVKKGKASVDPTCSRASSTHIYEDSNGLVWKATLNQADIGNNNNKFYLIQLLEGDSDGKYYTWNRWGRQGLTGQNKLQPFPSLDEAKRDFSKKFRDKTLQAWELTPGHEYIKKPGKYMVIDIDENDDEDEEDQKKKSTPSSTSSSSSSSTPSIPPPIPKSNLDPAVRKFVEFISNQKAMVDVMEEFEVDVAKFPLGKLKKSHIQKGYNYLKDIEKALKKSTVNRQELMDLSSMFYTLIPTPVGMHRLPVIDNMKSLDTKMKLLEALADIEIAQTLIKKVKDDTEQIDVIDKTYNSLNIKLTHLPKDTAQFKLINDFVQNTHGHTHSQYTLEIQHLFAIERPDEVTRFKAWEANENRMLLWHGSRRTNWMGILSQGLRIAPPEAPATGYMFGKGVYFADMVSKSANYCFTNSQSPEGVMMLCEVALGTPFECKNATYMEKAQPGTQSTKGLGRSIPDPDGDYHMDNGCVIPMGKEAQSKDTSLVLQYNEFIVYDVAQIRAAYVLYLKFNYKGNTGFYF